MAVAGAVVRTGIGRLAGQLPGEEVVPGIPFLHLDQRAGAPQRGNVLQKNDFHDSASAGTGRGASRSRIGKTESSKPKIKSTLLKIGLKASQSNRRIRKIGNIR